jgi:hypothetical protein
MGFPISLIYIFGGKIMILYSFKENRNTNIYYDHNVEIVDYDFQYADNNIRLILDDYVSNDSYVIIYFIIDKKPPYYQDWPLDREDYLNNYLTCRVYIYDPTDDSIKRFENRSSYESINDYDVFIRSEESDFVEHQTYPIGSSVLIKYNKEIQLCKITSFTQPNIYGLEYIKTVGSCDMCRAYADIQYENKWHYNDLKLVES